MYIQSTSSFEHLPGETVGLILTHLNKMTGSEGIFNEADIPVIMKYACNLGCVSKQMNQKFNSLEATQLFLQSLAEKYGKGQEHFAAELNTLGARKWLWNHIKINGYMDVYQVIKNIYMVAREVKLEANRMGLRFELGVHQGQGSPNPFYCQTKSGISLFIGSTPSHLCTPFGQLKIYGGGICSDESYLPVSERFIKRISAIFERILPLSKHDEYNGGDATCEISPPSNGSDDMRLIGSAYKKEISKEDAQEKKGSNNLIIGGGGSVYIIKQFGNITLPEVSWYASKDECRSYELVNMIWNMCEKNSSGLEPITKKLKEKEAVKQAQSPLFKNLSEVVPHSINLVKQLSEQPIFKGKKDIINSNVKILVLDNPTSSETFIVELLNRAADQFIPNEMKWNINRFGCGNDRIYDENGKNMGEGLRLFLSKSKDSSCDIESLENTFKIVLQNITQNWTKANYKDYPNIVHTKSEEEYVLFIKKEKLFQLESDLLRGIAHQLGVGEYIKCYDSWKGNLDRDPNRPSYLWIRKDKFDEVIRALQLTCS